MGDADYGLADEISGTAGFPDPLNSTKFAWPAQTGATNYQVARGSSATFTSGCVVVTTSNAYIIDAGVPPLGGTLFYVVRPSLPHAGSWGRRSDGVPRAVPCAP